MKKLIFLLFPFLMLAQNPINPPYGIKNAAATSDSAPAYFVTSQTDGVHKKTPAALVAFKSDLPVSYAVIVYVNDISPLTATIFDDENPPTTNDNAFKADVDNLYIGTDASTWVWNGSTYVTKTVSALSNFKIIPNIDAGNNKSAYIYREGSVGSEGYFSSKLGYYINKNGSNIAKSGGFLTFNSYDTPNAMMFQLNASNGLDLWNFTSSTWTKRFTFSSAGNFTAATYNGYTPENSSNKQNDLTVDGTGVKYTTVDAVNTIKGNFITIASSTASDNAKQTANFVCDGVNDDVEINAAIQSLPAWGGRIQLTNGLFYINSSIVIDRAITLVGEGTGIAGRNVGNMYGATEGITTLRASSDIDVLKVDSAFKIKGIKLADFILQGFGKDVSDKIGIYVKTDTDMMQITGVNVLDCGIGLFGYSFDATTIVASSFQYNALGGLIVTSAYVNIVSCVFADNNGKDTVIVGGTTYTVQTGGLAIGGFNSMITASTFVRNDKSGTPYNSISVLNATSMRINNCAVNEQNGNAIGIIGTAASFAEDTQISNSTITRFGTSLTAGKRNGVYIKKGHATQIFGNYIGSGLGFTNSEYAVYEDRVTDTYTGVTLVKNNIFRALQSVSKVYLTGAQSNYIKNVNVGESDTDNQAFTGIVSTSNTGATRVNAIELKQAGTNQDGVFVITNTTTGTGEVKYNNSTGIMSKTVNSSSGIGTRLSNTSSGTGYYGLNSNSGIFDYRENQSTGILNIFESTTASTGDLLQFRKNGNVTTKFDHNGILTTPSPIFTGTPLAPTAPAGTNTTQIATTAFVQGEKAITVRKISTNTTLSNSDNGKVILLTASCTVTLPNGLMSGFNVSFATQAGATLTYSLGGSVVLVNNAGTTMGQNLSHTIVNTGVANEYLTAGEL